MNLAGRELVVNHLTDDPDAESVVGDIVVIEDIWGSGDNIWLICRNKRLGKSCPYKLDQFDDPALTKLRGQTG
jgi:hypothetical protein